MLMFINCLMNPMFNLKIIKPIQVNIHSIDVIELSVHNILSQEKTTI